MGRNDRRAGGSITHWIGQLRQGDEGEAQRQLWRHYFESLVQLARRRLGASNRAVMDEEDAAMSAMQSFFHRFREGKFPELDDRDALWPLLITMTARKVASQIRWSNAQRRGAGRAAAACEDQVNPLEQVAGREPTADFLAQAVEETNRLLAQLAQPELRTTALLKLEGYSNREISEKAGVIERTIERRLTLIRTLWANSVSDS